MAEKITVSRPVYFVIFENTLANPPLYFTSTYTSRKQLDKVLASPGSAYKLTVYEHNGQDFIKI